MRKANVSLLIIFICILLPLFLLGACVRQKMVLHYIAADESADPSATPAVQYIELPVLTGQPFAQDANGLPIIDEKTHYFDNYLHFYDIRVYTYGDSTLLDGNCTNKFQYPLVGAMRICFFDKDGNLVGTGEVTSAEGDLRLVAGENNIYATIYAEGDVRLTDFQFEVVTPLVPEE